MALRPPVSAISLATGPSRAARARVMARPGSVAPVECIDNPRVCNRSDYCATRDVWSELKDVIDGVLTSTTLKDLAEKQKKKGQPGASMYYI